MMKADRPRQRDTYLASRAIAARYLAIGTTKEYAAEHADVSRETIHHWLTEPAFQREVDRLREQAISRVEPAILANLHLALEVQRQVLNGMIDVKEGRWRTAEKLIERFFDKLFATEPVPEPAAGGFPGAGTAVQVNFNGPGPTPGSGGPIYELPAG